MTEFVSVLDCADLLHVSPGVIRQHIRNGDLPAVRISGRLSMCKADVEALAHLIVPAPTLVIKPVTPEAIARLRAISAHLDSVRAEMKPLGMSTAELIRLAREEEEAKYDDCTHAG